MIGVKFFALHLFCVFYIIQKGRIFMKNLDYGNLLDFYKNILSEKQLEALDLYYNQDCSLSEIAGQFGISRQGVRDAIKRGEAELLLLEEKLGMIKKLKSIEEKAELIKSHTDDQKVISEIDRLIEEIYI